MRGGVDAARVEIKPDGLGDFAIERLLRRDGIICFEKVFRDRPAPLHRRPQHGHQRGTKLREERLEL